MAKANIHTGVKTKKALIKSDKDLYDATRCCISSTKPSIRLETRGLESLLSYCFPFQERHLFLPTWDNQLLCFIVNGKTWYQFIAGTTS